MLSIWSGQVTLPWTVCFWIDRHFLPDKIKKKNLIVNFFFKNLYEWLFISLRNFIMYWFHKNTILIDRINRFTNVTFETNTSNLPNHVCFHNQLWCKQRHPAEEACVRAWRHRVWLRLPTVCSEVSASQLASLPFLLHLTMVWRGNHESPRRFSRFQP